MHPHLGEVTMDSLADLLAEQGRDVSL